MILSTSIINVINIYTVIKNSIKIALPDNNSSSSIFMVPETGVEPARGYPHGILSPGRLPIPPLRHINQISEYISLGCCLFSKL